MIVQIQMSIEEDFCPNFFFFFDLSFSQKTTGIEPSPMCLHLLDYYLSLKYSGVAELILNNIDIIHVVSICVGSSRLAGCLEEVRAVIISAYWKFQTNLLSPH